MSKILSQDEIDALLSAPGESARIEVPPAVQEPPAVIRYNFRRPDRVSKEQIHSLHFLHDRFARNVATSMSARKVAMPLKGATQRYQTEFDPNLFA